MAVAQQPMKVEMGLHPALPQSLQYLAGLDKLIIQQKIELFEVLTGFEMQNKYAVLNRDLQQIFYVKEESDTCERLCCPLNRGFNLKMTDNNSVEVVNFTREFKFCTGCCWCADGCCNMRVNVESPPGNVIGWIKSANSKWKAHMRVFDATGNHLFTIWGPCCPCQAICCTEDIDFPVMDRSMQTRVGNIAKQWRGCCVDFATDADQFAITFPVDMTVECKALLMGATFLLEFLVFEEQKNNNNH